MVNWFMSFDIGSTGTAAQLPHHAARRDTLALSTRSSTPKRIDTGAERRKTGARRGDVYDREGAVGTTSASPTAVMPSIPNLTRLLSVGRRRSPYF